MTEFVDELPNADCLSRNERLKVAQSKDKNRWIAQSWLANLCN